MSNGFGQIVYRLVEFLAEGQMCNGWGQIVYWMIEIHAQS
ncbi:MAG: hypothetical protein Hyperionvirus4_59 [Hyperionvirus sp.]|uniref:Uncharacterized protein n=1 Tax=Hyperionvirus sp. TaxID=2487770 RepID=A0A3G5A9D4_9VIRU|nr:MAG: hypothetical protein Hyperionvirus4_59 [Hyperionvirus sp.]